jgi:hypothetical protein
MHDGKRNTIHVDKVGKNFKLLPMKEEVGECNSSRVGLYLAKEYLEKEKRADLCLADLLKDNRKEEEHVVSMEMQNLLGSGLITGNASPFPILVV